ncbi:MAG: tetratricopeptide repeat protein [Candidatus Thorarchaeota archaeon]
MSLEGLTAQQWLSKARTLRQQGQNKKSIEAYRKVLQLEPNNLDALNEVGLVHIHIGEQQDAVVVFDYAIDVSASDYRAHSNKAEAQLTLGAFEEALAAAETGLKYAPDNAELWIKKARALESLFRIPEAIEAYNEALKHDSSNPESWKALALCYDAQENWPAVARAYRIAAGLHEKRGEAQEAESCMKFAELAEKSE